MKRKSILFAGAAILAALALAAAYFYIPGERPSLGEGTVHVCLNSDGSMEFTWPEALSPASYRLEVRWDGQHAVFNTSAPSAASDELALPLELRLQAVTVGKNLLGMPRELAGRPLEATVERADMSAPRVTGTPGPGNLSLTWELAGAAPDLYEVFVLEEGLPRHAASTEGKSVSLKVGREGDLPLPAYGSPLQASVRAGIQGEGYVLCGPASNQITVERQDLLGDDLNLAYQETEPLHYTLEWDETRGEYYELQEWDGGDWTLLDTLEPAERISVDLGRLGSGSCHRYQVTAKDRNGTARSSEEVEFFASISPLYATVWPIVDQSFYELPGTESEALGKIPAGTALCVLEEQGDWFQVRYKDRFGYVDSRFCMINLPEYVGDHCSYDITNSYRSVFKVHENPIALITDQVIKGFEHIQTADERFLVPYLYPCSKKLLSAAQAAEKDGYRLKIYEAFRPNEATRFLYDTTAAQLDWAALVYGGEPGDEDREVLDPVTGWVVDLADGLLTDPESKEKLSREDLALRQAEEAQAAAEEAGLAAQKGAEPAAPEAEPQIPGAEETPESPFFTLPEEGEGGSLQPEEPPAESPPPAAPQPDAQPQEEAGPPESAEAEEEPAPEYDTYFKIMTNNGRFHLGSFLARVTSAHNRGIALDLTLEKISSGEELKMQSAIHDLSWYSAAYLNNDNAKLLEKYMTATGMRGLTSEWWHFQDDETRESIGLSSYLFKGVHMGGWTRDEQGWRYRNEDGSFFRSTSVTVDGVRYTLDAEGYVKE
ncbi:MAG: SH3 domain-containing protein [Oscillibacter sp.]|nr:SH3 domain-containing protein [Oscillibacter sp.]